MGKKRDYGGSEDSPDACFGAPGQPQHPAVGDHATGAFLAGGVGFALLHRQRTGRGQLVDASLQHSGVWCNAWLIVSAASDPELGERWTRERGDYGFGPSANVCESVSALRVALTVSPSFFCRRDC